jgi:hypothetical protein
VGRVPNWDTASSYDVVVGVVPSQSANRAHGICASHSVLLFRLFGNEGVAGRARRVGGGVGVEVS